MFPLAARSLARPAPLLRRANSTQPNPHRRSLFPYVAAAGAGGGVVLLAGYIWYYFSGVRKAVETTQRARAVVRNSYAKFVGDKDKAVDTDADASQETPKKPGLQRLQEWAKSKDVAVVSVQVETPEEVHTLSAVSVPEDTVKDRRTLVNARTFKFRRDKESRAKRDEGLRPEEGQE